MDKGQLMGGRRLTTRQVAELYQVTIRTVANWRNSGVIPFVRINARCIRYDLAAVVSALERRNPRKLNVDPHFRGRIQSLS
jgi:predicted site-specific integrase-resolvase